MYEQSSDPNIKNVYKQHLRILMDNLLFAFDFHTNTISNPYSMPSSNVNLFTHELQNSNCNGRCVVLADMASIQLEFAAACDILQNMTYCLKSDHIINILDPKSKEYAFGKQSLEGHHPILINLDGSYGSNIYRWGAMADSYYEYLLKLFIYEKYSETRLNVGHQSQSRIEQYRRLYVTAVDSMLEHLYKYNKPSKLYYIAELENGKLRHKMDELACFIGGNLALAYYYNISENHQKSEVYFQSAVQLTETCYQMFAKVNIVLFEILCFVIFFWADVFWFGCRVQ